MTKSASVRQLALWDAHDEGLSGFRDFRQDIGRIPDLSGAMKR